MGIIVNVRLVLNVDCEAEAADAINEILRDHLQQYAPGSCLVDYAQEGCAPYTIAADYEEGEAFNVESV